ncbi:MAG: gmr 3 [Herminiimonas sp.]|nr:gmr 3 [Herminiimonas sp.]
MTRTISQEESPLHLYFGTTTPYWQLCADSNALQFASEDRSAVNVAVALQAEQASALRSMTGATSHVDMTLSLYGEPIRMHLVGRRIDKMRWAGTAADYLDTASVVRSLIAVISSSEQVVSEVNSLVVLVDSELKIRRFNRLCEELTGLTEAEVLGRDVHDGFIAESDVDAARINMKAFFATGHSFEAERPCIGKNGMRQILWRNKMVRSGSGPSEWYLVCSGTDVTEERRAQARLVDLANNDALTRLPNRHAVQELITRMVGSGDPFGIMFIDLDNFKNVNDHYGHLVGDSLIQSSAIAIKACLGEGDVLARLGGDEFLAVVKEPASRNLEDAAQRIMSRMKTSFNLERCEVYSSCSIGIAMYPQHGTTHEELVRNADTALYVAKSKGRHTYRTFEAEMNRKVAERVWLDTNLRKALEEDQFELFYQPKVNLRTGMMAGVEALVRWNSPERGLIMPADFIPYAEESGIIVELGKWVMEEAARQTGRWKKRGLEIPIAINLSARQLRSATLVEDFTAAVLRADIEPSMLGLELTESCMADDEALAHRVMREFRDLGVTMYLDDFGTGYSSISQLSRMPMDVLKLDRTFINSIHTDLRARALVRSMVAVAQELKLKVVAEGVETRQQAEFLRELNVEFAQGYLFAYPMSAKGVEAWMAPAASAPLRVVA